MSNPLLLFWYRLFATEPVRRPPRWRVPMSTSRKASATIFLVMRRMRVPLIVLIVIFAISTVGLTLIPGQDAEGRPWRMGFFDAFYVMSFTASTIGFGEIPYPFTYNQRMWLTISIYLTVVGWAYAIGSLLALLQERGFRQALALQHFTRKVERMREPFLLIVGYGRTGELLARSLDALGRRFVVIDRDDGRIDDLDLDSYHADVPGLVADAGDPGHLAVAGLDLPSCEGVLALTDDDEANLAVVQAAALLRPDLPVITRAVSPTTAERMRAFGTPTVVNPFDRFGDHLRIALRAPASYQLMTWLESGPGRSVAAPGIPAVARALGDLRVRSLRAGGYSGPAGGGSRRYRGGALGRGRAPPGHHRRIRLRTGGAGPRRDRTRRRVRRRHGQRHHQPLADRCGPAGQPDAVRRGPAEQGGQCAAVRRCRGRLDARPRGRRRT